MREKLQSEAGSRAQSEIRCGVTLALMGRGQGKLNVKFLKKRPRQQPGTRKGDLEK